MELTPDIIDYADKVASRFGNRGALTSREDLFQNALLQLLTMRDNPEAVRTIIYRQALQVLRREYVRRGERLRDVHFARESEPIEQDYNFAELKRFDPVRRACFIRIRCERESPETVADELKISVADAMKKARHVARMLRLVERRKNKVTV